MKHGRYLMNYLINESFRDKENAIANLGDSIQALAMDSIYEQLGIRREELCYIKRDFIGEYDGDPVKIVHHTELVKNNAKKRMDFSERIDVKGLVSAVFYNDLPELDEAYPECSSRIKSLAPVCARDETSLKILEKNGVEAYLTGCFTICFPRRNTQPAKEKVFLVDIPQDLIPYIPKEILAKSESLTHAVQIRKYPADAEENLRLENLAKELLEKYRDEATLVITGRLHAAIPCIAMGIPVIFACNNLDFRFEWIDKIIYPYQFDEYKDIDWHPAPIDVEDVKNHFLKLFDGLLKGYEVRTEMKWLNDYYMDRKRVKPYRFFRTILADLNGKYNKDNEFCYAIWGAGFHCDYAFELMQEMYPKAKLVAVVDKYKEGNFKGVPIIRGTQLEELVFEHLIITTAKGKEEALEWIESNRFGCHFSVIVSQQKS